MPEIIFHLYSISYLSSAATPSRGNGETVKTSDARQRNDQTTRPQPMDALLEESQALTLNVLSCPWYFTPGKGRF
jgi:hypothetical protein